MVQKQLLWVAVVGALVLALVSITQIDIVSAQQGGEGGVGGAGGAGGEGGFGGGGGALSAFGDFVYVLERGILYQYAAYDLKLVNKSDLSGKGAGNRIRGGRAGGRGGDGAPGADGNGGRGGDGGAGGSGGYGAGGFGRSEDVAAYGEFVYVLQGKTLRKLYANGLKPITIVTLDFDAKAGK